MRARTRRHAVVSVTATLLVLAGSLPATAAPPGPGAYPPASPHDPTAAPRIPGAKPQGDDLGSPLSRRRDALRQAAISQTLADGTAKVRTDKHGSRVLDLGAAAPRSLAATDRATPQGVPRTRYAELSRQTTDQMFVILVDFGDERAPGYPDQDTSFLVPGPQRFDGPQANQIPAPNRLTDNTTPWRPNYDRDYYQQLYFSRTPGAGSVANYYATQSSGRYTIDGEVTDWVRVKYNEARYGRSDGYPCPGRICSNIWALIDDALAAWVAAQKAHGATTEQIRERLARYDQWDRYDYDNDGNFNEPDGYLDHFQLVHAGPDQASGSALYGEDAIWSHRWYSHQDKVGTAGPDSNKLGGSPVGDTGLWVGDYTIQAENAGLGVFTHEFGHDLGLPDEYDTYGNDAATGYWTLMSGGEYLGRGRESLGDLPGAFSAWDKLQLGWLDYQVAYPGEHDRFTLGAAQAPGTNPQALVAILPEKRKILPLGKPPEGTHAWWGGRGDDLHTALIRFLAVPAGQPAALKFKAWYDLEAGYDTARVEVNDNSGWKTLPGSITNPALGDVITGNSDGWQDASFDLSAYAGKQIQLRIRYDSDSSVTSLGIMLDAITATSGNTVLFSDGAEQGSNGWIPAGFRTTTGTEDIFYPQYYLAEYRTYDGADAGLRTGPYGYGFPRTRPDFVEHYPYQDGLLVWQWDTSMADNDVSLHPCEGEILAVDAKPQILRTPSGAMWRPRYQIYDATFGRTATDAFTLHEQNEPQRIPSHPGVPVFDDTKAYCNPQLPYAGVTTARSKTKLSVVAQTPTSVTVDATVGN